jgi:hypothetical protein
MQHTANLWCATQPSCEAQRLSDQAHRSTASWVLERPHQDLARAHLVAAGCKGFLQLHIVSERVCCCGGCVSRQHLLACCARLCCANRPWLVLLLAGCALLKCATVSWQ